MTNLSYSDYDFSKIPFNEIVQIGQRTLLYQDLFNVSWILGRYCNYNCSYCWPYARSDIKDHRPLDLLMSTMDEIKRQARLNDFNSFHFSFSGGEPTLHPGFLKLLEYYVDDLDNCNSQTCHITSNLSPGISWFKKLVETTKKLHRVSMTGSWHREFASKEDFRDKILFLQKNDVFVTVNLVMVPQLFEQHYEDAIFFNKAGINVTLKAQSNSKANKVVDGYSKQQLDILCNGMPQRNYTTEQMRVNNITSKRPPFKKSLKEIEIDDEKDKSLIQKMQVELIDDFGKKWYLDQSERFNSFNFNNFKGWVCNAGFQGIVIREPDGSIKRGYSCHDTPLGNILTGFRLFDSPVECITPSCVASVDSKMPKKKLDKVLHINLDTIYHYRRYNRIIVNWHKESNRSLKEILTLSTRFIFRFQEYFTYRKLLNNFYQTLELMPIEIAERAFSKTQFESKAWIMKVLDELKLYNLGMTYILGGWCGLLGQFLLSDKKINVKQIFSFDIDEMANIYADKLNDDFKIKEWKFKSVTHDIYGLNYEKDELIIDDIEEKKITVSLMADTIFNTCCEHIDLEKWLAKVPPGKRLVLQSNNLDDEPGHINCHNNLAEFISALDLSEIKYKGTLNLGHYDRFLVVGIK